jgi:mRNA interferase RelE/StbE
MPLYSLLILPRAQKELERLPAAPSKRIVSAIRALAQNPRPQGSLKLAGREGWRIRVGDYRIVYEMDDKSATITILHIGHRRNIYQLI